MKKSYDPRPSLRDKVMHERDYAIWRYYNNGIGVYELSYNFEISERRIRQIIAIASKSKKGDA